MMAVNVKLIACYLKAAQIAAFKKLSAGSGALVEDYLRLAVDQFLVTNMPAKR
jgi:hypothetical protein